MEAETVRKSIRENHKEAEEGKIQEVTDALTEAGFVVEIKEATVYSFGSTHMILRDGQRVGSFDVWFNNTNSYSRHPVINGVRLTANHFKSRNEYDRRTYSVKNITSWGSRNFKSVDSFIKSAMNNCVPVSTEEEDDIDYRAQLKVLLTKKTGAETKMHNFMKFDISVNETINALLQNTTLSEWQVGNLDKLQKEFVKCRQEYNDFIQKNIGC